MPSEYCLEVTSTPHLSMTGCVCTSMCRCAHLDRIGALKYAVFHYAFYVYSVSVTQIDHSITLKEW